MKRKRKRIREALLKTFIMLNLMSLLVFLSAADSDNIVLPLVMVLVNILCLIISGFYY
jgi:hypothetical protein